MAEVVVEYQPSDEALKEIEKVATPEQKTIEAVSTFLHVEPAQVIKSLIFDVDGELVVVLARGDHEINDIKLKNALNADSVELASEATIRELLSTRCWLNWSSEITSGCKGSSRQCREGNSQWRCWRK